MNLIAYLQVSNVFVPLLALAVDYTVLSCCSQMRSYQFQNLPSNWSRPYPILISLRAAPPAGSIILTYPQTELVTEGSIFDLRFSIEGQAVDDVPFSLQPLTYQQFETLSGQRVANIFSDVPTAASFS